MEVQGATAATGCDQKEIADISGLITLLEIVIHMVVVADKWQRSKPKAKTCLPGVERSIIGRTPNGATKIYMGFWALSRMLRASIA